MLLCNSYYVIMQQLLCYNATVIMLLCNSYYVVEPVPQLLDADHDLLAPAQTVITAIKLLGSKSLRLKPQGSSFFL